MAVPWKCRYLLHDKPSRNPPTVRLQGHTENVHSMKSKMITSDCVKNKAHEKGLEIKYIIKGNSLTIALKLFRKHFIQAMHRLQFEALFLLICLTTVEQMVKSRNGKEHRCIRWSVKIN